MKGLKKIMCLLLVFTLLMPLVTECIPVNAASYYISELALGHYRYNSPDTYEMDFATAKSFLSGKGYTVINKDLNEDVYGDFIVLGYKTSTSKSDAITDIRVYKGYSPPSSYTYNVNGKACKYYPVKDTDGKPYDLNKDARYNCRPIYLYYTKDDAAGGGIYRLSAGTSGSQSVKYFGGSGSADLNYGAFGKKISLSYEADSRSYNESDLSANDILDKYGFDLTKVLSNITFEGEKIKGPSVTVLGKEFPLFEFDAKINLPILNNSSVTVDNDKKLIKVLIGVKDTQSADVGKASQSSNYWSEAYRDVKNMYQNVTGNKVDTTKLWNQYSKLRSNLRSINASMGFECDATLVGYAEFSYASGKVKFNGGGLITELSFGTTIKTVWPAFPAAYVAFGLTLGVGAKLKIEYKNTFYVNGNISGKIEGTFAVGLGEKGIAKTYIEGRMGAKMIANLNFPIRSMKQDFTLNMDGTFYVECYGLGYPLYDKEFPFASVSLYPQIANRPKLMALRLPQAKTATQTIERDYVTDNSELILDANSFVKDDIFAYNAPSLVEFGDNKGMLVWIDDDGTKDIRNRTTVYYSVLENNAWSMPAPVAVNDGYNDAPVVLADGEKVYVVWQQTGKIGDDDTYGDTLKTVELVYSCYDGESFSEPIIITKDEFCEFDYQFHKENDTVYLTWMTNSENDFQIVSGENYIHSVALNDINNIVSSKLDFEFEEITVASVVENVLYYINTDGEKYSLIQKTDSGSNVIFSDVLEISNVEVFDEYVYFLVGDVLYKYSPAENTVALQNLSGLSNFTIIKDYASYPVLLTLCQEGDGTSTLKMSTTIVNNWSVLSPVKSFDDYIRNYSAAYVGSSCLFATNTVEYNEVPEQDGLFGKATLSVFQRPYFSDLQMGKFLTCDEKTLKEENKLNFYFEVTNNGSVATTSILVTCTNESTGETKEQIVSHEMAVGATDVITVEFDAFEDSVNTELTVSVACSGYEDVVPSDNSRSTTVGYVDLEISDVEFFNLENGAYIKANIANIGFGQLSEVNIELADEDKAISETVCDISEESTVIVQIPDEYLSALETDTFVSLKLKVSSEYTEIYYENNEIHIVYSHYADIQPSEECVDHIPVTEVVPPSCTSTGYTKTVCELCEEELNFDELECPGHSLKTQIIDQKAATCYEEGYVTEQGYCEVCDEVLSTSTTVLAVIPHTPGELEIEDRIDSTCTENGHYIEVVYCTVEACHAIVSAETKIIPLKNHEDLNSDNHCDVCEKNLTVGDGEKPEVCSHMCHSSNAFLSFLWKIINFFSMLFGANPTCSCGVAHY